jgi:ribosome biogenesis protein Nip4
MPSQKADVTQKKQLKDFDHYTQVPVLLFQILSYARLQGIDSMLLNHIALHSLNFHSNSYARSWIKVSPSEFANERGCTRQKVSESLAKLSKFGFIDSQSAIYQTNSGMQKGREFRLVSNQKLSALFDVLNTSALHQGDKPWVTPETSVKVLGDKSQVTPCQAIGDTLSGHRLHLVRPWVTPWGVKVPESLENLPAKESLNNIKEFINKFGDFENSYLELYTLESNSRRAFFNTEMEIAALIRRYGLFSTFIAMTTNLFSEDANLGDLKSLTTFLEINEVKIKEQEQMIMLHCTNLFNSIIKIHEETPIQDLEIFQENFRQNASVLLLKSEFEQSSNKIFFYSSFPRDIVHIFETCNFNLDRFTNEILRKINIYFQTKILGVRGLDFVQSQNH